MGQGLRPWISQLHRTEIQILGLANSVWPKPQLPLLKNERITKRETVGSIT